MRTLKNTQLKKYGLFFYAVKNDFRSYLRFQVCVRAAIGNLPEEEGPIAHDNETSSYNHNNVTKGQSADSSPLVVKKEINSTLSTSELTTEKLLDVVFYYQELLVEWVKRVSPRPSPLTLACGATLYLVAVCTAMQRQEGDRWFSVFIDSKVPGLSEPSQKSVWDSFENVTSQYVTLNQKGQPLHSHIIGSSPKVMGPQPPSTYAGQPEQSAGRVREGDPMEENYETQSLCDSSVISRVDLYKKRVLIRLKSPWDKQSRHQYAGLFYDQNKLEEFEKMNRGKVLPDTSSSLPGTHKTLLQSQCGGIQPWYKIEARNDYNPILLSEGVTSKKEQNFYDNNNPSPPPLVEGQHFVPSTHVLYLASQNQSTKVSDLALQNPLEKTKNWFPITNKLSLWNYFHLQRSHEQVYFGGDNVPSKLDSAFFCSSFISSSSSPPPLVEGTGQKSEGCTFSRAKIDENVFLKEEKDNNNKNQSQVEIIEHLYINQPNFSLSNLGLEKVKAFSDKSTRSTSQFQKLPLKQKSTFGFTSCHFGEFNPSPLGQHFVPSTSVLRSSLSAPPLVGVSRFSNHSYQTSMNGRMLAEANTSDKLYLSKQILDPQKLKVWFERNKDLANGDEFYAFENKLKSLFYSQGILPFPELDDLDDEFFEEIEEKQEKSFSDFTKEGQESSDSELLPLSEQRDKADFAEYRSSQKESLLGEEAKNVLPPSKQNLFCQDVNDSISDVSSSLPPPITSGVREGDLVEGQHFEPSHFYKNTWISPRFMSGYQFPELTKRDLFCLQKRFVIRHLLPSLKKACIELEKGFFFPVFNTQKLASKISLLPLEINLPPVLPASLFRDMFSPSFFNSFIDQPERGITFFESETGRSEPPLGGKQGALETINPQRVKIPSQGITFFESETGCSPPLVEAPELKLTYRVIRLEEEKEVEKAFTRLGRDYKDYLSYPKDGLEALKVSPSLEDEEKQKDSLEEAKEKDRKGELAKTLKKFAFRKGYAVKKEKETSDLPDINKSDLNPWISSLWGPDNMLSDRKTDFLGRKNVLRKRLISRERQDIAAEILNVKNPPLPKLKTRARRNEIQLLRPAKLEAKNDVGSQHHVLKVNSVLRKKRVIATHLVTPFQTHHIMPEISKNEWRQMIEYQLRQYFFEEDKRLEPLVKKNPHHHFKIQRVNTFLPWVRIRTPKEKAVEWPLTRLDYDKIHGTKPERGSGRPPLVEAQDFVFPSPSDQHFVPRYSTLNANGSVKIPKFQAPPQNFTQNLVSKHKVTLSSRKGEANTDSFLSFPPGSSLPAYDNSGFSSLATQNQHITRDQYRWVPSKLREWSNYVLEEINKFKLTPSHGKKVLSQQLTFEPFTKHSWLLIYRFFLAFALRDLLKYLYRVTLKDFMIGMAHTHFGLAVTSEDFRKWLQYVPPKLFYKPHKRLQDITGLNDLIPSLAEIIWFLRNSGRGRGVPRGVLLVGPPGTGKTALVQAIAGEAQVPVVVQSMSALSIPDPDKRPHERLEEMFQTARQQAPCILFLDEIDRIAQSRGNVSTNDIGAPDFLFSLEGDVGGELSYSLETELLPEGDPSLASMHLKDVALHQEKKEREARRVNILLRLLTEIDGLRPLNGVVLIATTDRPAVLDPALLRPGRFSKMIHLQLPSHEKRIELFKLHTKKLGSLEKMPWDYLASRTAHLSGADIAAAINHSAIRAILTNTVHTLDTLEHGLNYVTGAPVSFPTLPDPVNHQQRKSRVRASLGGHETSSKAPSFPPKGGSEQPKLRSGSRKTKLSKTRVSEKVAKTIYAVYGVFKQEVYTRELSSQKSVFRVNKHFSQRIKEACKTSRFAYYQAGKGVVQSVLPRHPNVGFLALSSDNNNEPPFTNKSWDRITSSQSNHRKVDLETRLVGLYAGKAGELLHLNVNSLKNDSSFQSTTVSKMRFQLADHNRTWLSQSNLGVYELLFASSLAHVMIDRWYLYSKRMFAFKTNSLIVSLNEEEILNDDLFPMFAKLCEELERDRPKELLPDAVETEAERKAIVRAQKAGEIHEKGNDQQRVILDWWHDLMCKRMEMYERPYGRWYRLYLPKPEERERNEEWLAPDFYYHPGLDLASITQDKSNDIDALKLRSKALRKVLTQSPTHLSAQSNQESETERKQFVFLPKTNKIKCTKPERTLCSRPISLSFQAVKTWNDMYWLERDYSYHNLVTNCFYTSFLLLDENRELLDFLADHLIRFEKLRKHEILRICSLFQVKSCSLHDLTRESQADKQTHQDQMSTAKKNVILSESSAPFVPSWWEQKTLEVTMKSESEPTDFGEGVKRKDKAQSADYTRTFPPAALRRKAQSADFPPKVAKKKESKDYSNLLLMTEKAGENLEPKLQENQQEKFKETADLGQNESDKTQKESTSLMRISPTSSTSTDTSDAHKKAHNVENDRFWILEKGWGRFSKYKKPNFIRFDFIKVR